MATLCKHRSLLHITSSIYDTRYIPLSLNSNRSYVSIDFKRQFKPGSLLGSAEWLGPNGGGKPVGFSVNHSSVGSNSSNGSNTRMYRREGDKVGRRKDGSRRGRDLLQRVRAVEIAHPFFSS
ncbi:hypothetical protein L2E82_04881 [Cichorium intybus]|uniref:Uncharacterized protein n=1 Tax=Cichorium intybus TaxID=13427 RepID=A0ACB9H617_CICIN|nr:hypothetical protein L2E82_04881 [Cichorium intybus]